jgi:hypothetical protein
MDRPYSRCLILALLALALPALAVEHAGFPTGKWLLDKAGSRAMAAKSQILEIIKDDGEFLSFAIHQIGSDGNASLLQWNGDYGAEPRPVQGSAITFGVAHGAGGSILISGHQPDGGRFEEVCRVAPSKRHFQCDGMKWESDGKQSTYVEVYDLVQ